MQTLCPIHIELREARNETLRLS